MFIVKYTCYDPKAFDTHCQSISDNYNLEWAPPKVTLYVEIPTEEELAIWLARSTGMASNIRIFSAKEVKCKVAVEFLS